MAEKTGRGCFFYGCLTVIILVVLAVVGTGIGGFFLYKKIVNDFTSPQPVSFSEVNISPDEKKALQERVSRFSNAISSGQPTEILTLNETEINALLQGNPEVKKSLHVTVKDSIIGGQLSVPLSALPWDKMGLLKHLKGGLQDRYFNGSAEFSVELKNGAALFYIQKLSTKDQPAAEWLMQSLRQENLAKEINNKPELTAKLSHFESVNVINDQLVITPKNIAKEPVAPVVQEVTPTPVLDPPQGLSAGDAPPVPLAPFPAPKPFPIPISALTISSVLGDAALGDATVTFNKKLVVNVGEWFSVDHNGKTFSVKLVSINENEFTVENEGQTETFPYSNPQ
ncbi:MAG: hypothetical protein SGI71_08300 [Verrucomicrobiota bacterium]|nr:hypothetical protein [Verrucomicrobiota bacterium]